MRVLQEFGETLGKAEESGFSELCLKSRRIDTGISKMLKE